MCSDLVAMPGGGPATEPPEEREPPSLADWLRRNNVPRCCGGSMYPYGEPDGDKVEFRCPCGNSQWVNIRPLSQREREED